MLSGVDLTACSRRERCARRELALRALSRLVCYYWTVSLRSLHLPCTPADVLLTPFIPAPVVFASSSLMIQCRGNSSSRAGAISAGLRRNRRCNGAYRTVCARTSASFFRSDGSWIPHTRTPSFLWRRRCLLAVAAGGQESASSMILAETWMWDPPFSGADVPPMRP